MNKLFVALAATFAISSLAANAGETVVAKGVYNNPGHMDNNTVKTVSLEVEATATFDSLPTKEERELLEKRLNDNPFCGSACQQWLKWPASIKEGEFLPSSGK